MQPIFPDRGYLEDQHLQVAVKSSDGDESFGKDIQRLTVTIPQHFCSAIYADVETLGF